MLEATCRRHRGLKGFLAELDQCANCQRELKHEQAMLDRSIARVDKRLKMLAAGRTGRVGFVMEKGWVAK